MWTDEEIEAFEAMTTNPHGECELCSRPGCKRALCQHPCCDERPMVAPMGDMKFSPGARSWVHENCVAGWENGEDVRPVAEPTRHVPDLLAQMRAMDLKFAGIDEVARLERKAVVR